MSSLKPLVLLLFLLLTAQAANAGNIILKLNCDILNENRFPQTTFFANDLAIFKVGVQLPKDENNLENDKQYHVNLKISATANIGGLKIPFNFNETLSVPIKGINDDTLFETREKALRLPPVTGKLTLKVDADVANVTEKRVKAATCKQTLTVK